MNRPMLMDEAKQADADLRALMERPAFRRWLLRLVNRSGILQSTFGPDSRTAAYMDGRRSLGLELLKEADAIEPHALARILSEPISTPRDPKHDRHHSTNPIDQLGDDD